MGLNINCGTEQMCEECSFRDVRPEVAQSLAKIAGCYIGMLPSDQVVNRALEIYDIDVSDVHHVPSKIRISSIKMTQNNCIGE